MTSMINQKQNSIYRHVKKYIAKNAYKYSIYLHVQHAYTYKQIQ